VVRLNLGSGEDNRSNFVNIDIRNLPGIDIVTDAANLKAGFANDSVDFIVAQHLLEYIPRNKMLPALTEWKRVLKPGALLEIRVLDIAAVTKALYLNSVSKEMGLHHEMVLALLYGTQDNVYNTKLNGFTNEFLQGVLTGLGLTVVHTVEEDYDIIITAKK